MTKQEKFQLVEELTKVFKATPNFYVTNTAGMTVEEVNNLRRTCFESGFKIKVIKNSLIKKVLDNLEGDYSELHEHLKYQSAVVFTTEDNPSGPAKMLKKYRKTSELPTLKAACIDTAVFAGEDQLDTLEKIKSKNELIGELVTILQSPAKNVISALQSGGNTLAGILKTLSEKEDN